MNFLQNSQIINDKKILLWIFESFSTFESSISMLAVQQYNYLKICDVKKSMNVETMYRRYVATNYIVHA